MKGRGRAKDRKEEGGRVKDKKGERRVDKERGRGESEGEGERSLKM